MRFPITRLIMRCCMSHKFFFEIHIYTKISSELCLVKGVFLMIFMIFFDNKGMNIIYLYFVNILCIYLRRNCEIFKFFFLRNMEDIGCCPSNVTIWSRYFRTFWKPQILSEINKVPNLASPHIWFLCEPNFTKKDRKFNFLWVCKQEKLIFGHFFITFLSFKKYLKQ